MAARPPALLVVVLLVFAGLAVHGSLRLPLWEVPDENEHFDVVQHWARGGSMPDLTQLPKLGLNEGIQPPLAYWILAGAARALDLQRYDILARHRHDPVGPDRALFLHGPDEVFPFAGPARRLHLLRLVSVLWGLATIAGTWALARRLMPGQRGLAAGAATLVAANPVFVLLNGGISNDAPAIALSTWSLVALADLATCAQPGTRRLLGTGALIGAALLTKLSALFLLPTAVVALLLRRRRDESLLASLRQGDRLIAGVLAVSGWYFAWNLATYGDPLGWTHLSGKYPGARGIPLGQAIVERFLPVFTWSWCGRLAAWVYAEWPVLLGWSTVATGGAAGLLFGRRWLAPAERRVTLLLVCAVIVQFLACLKFYVDFNQPQGRYLFPSIAAGCALLALGWSWLPRPLAVAGLAALLAAGVHAQTVTLAAAFHPLNRAHDPYLLCFDPVALAAPDARHETIRWLHPADGSRHAEAPELRWETAPDSRYSVHVTVPGIVLRVRTWEVTGRPLGDRFRIPAGVWSLLPPDVELVVRVVRLPPLHEALAALPGAARIEQSPPLRLLRP